MKIYISGKISDLPIEAAKAKFKWHAGFLELKGYEPVNPFDVEPIFEKALPEYSKDDIWGIFMAADIKELFACDAIYMLKDWGQSKGARVEYAIAKEIGLKIFYEGEFNN